MMRRNEEQYDSKGSILFYLAVNPEWFAKNGQFIGKFEETKRGKGLIYGEIYKVRDKFYRVYNIYEKKPHPVCCEYERQWRVKEIDETNIYWEE